MTNLKYKTRHDQILVHLIILPNNLILDNSDMLIFLASSTCNDKLTLLHSLPSQRVTRLVRKILLVKAVLLTGHCNLPDTPVIPCSFLPGVLLV